MIGNWIFLKTSLLRANSIRPIKKIWKTDKMESVGFSDSDTDKYLSIQINKRKASELTN